METFKINARLQLIEQSTFNDTVLSQRIWTCLLYACFCDDNTLFAFKRSLNVWTILARLNIVVMHLNCLLFHYYTFAFFPSEGSNSPQTKHWCCLYSQFLHRKFFIAYKQLEMNIWKIGGKETAMQSECSSSAKVQNYLNFCLRVPQCCTVRIFTIT